MRYDRIPVAVTPGERDLLQKWVRAGTTPQRIAARARIILLAADGLSNRMIARKLSLSAHTVALWLTRYRGGGPEILQHDAPGRGRRPTVQADAIERITRLLETPRTDGNRWTVRSLADATGVSRATVDRLRRSKSLT